MARILVTGGAGFIGSHLCERFLGEDHEVICVDNLLTGVGTGTITYLNSSDTPSASATFTVTVNDEGNTGDDPGSSGGPSDEEGTNNVTINITAMNDAPVVGAPGAPLAATEQTNLSIEGTGFTVADADEAGAGATATLSVTEGTITVVVGDSGVTIDSGDGTGTVTLSDTIAQLDNLLTGAGTGTITYLNSSDTPSASATFSRVGAISYRSDSCPAATFRASRLYPPPPRR